MTEEYKRKAFRCDRDGIHKLTEQLEKDAKKKGNYIIFNTRKNDEYSHIDITATAYTYTGECIAKYAIEFKERPDTAHTDCSDWMVEDDKEMYLKEAETEGYIPLFAYLWKDNYYALWNINKWDKSKPRKVYKKRHTMGNYNECKDAYYNCFVTLNSAVKQGYLN